MDRRGKKNKIEWEAKKRTNTRQPRVWCAGASVIALVKKKVPVRMRIPGRRQWSHGP
jgi:hypothetical protein